MKKLIFTLTFLFATYAQAFLLNTQCQFSPSNGECSVLNTTQSVISCQLRIYGQTSMGYSYSGFEFATLYPGQYAYIYVRANNPMMDPLVIVNGNANCRYVR